MAFPTIRRLLCLLSLVACLPCTMAQSTSQRLLLILLDGVRFDYLNQSSLPLPGFDKLAREGVKAGGLVPVFPSSSYPNYYTLMTGLFTESHGMTSNFMYDVTRQESFLIGTNPEQFHDHWWNKAEPIWVSAARENKLTHMYYWPGCEVEIRGIRPSFCKNYSSVTTLDEFRTALSSSLSLLRSARTDIAAVFFDLTDHLGHKYGPFSSELNNVLLDLDPIISDLVDQLVDPGMSEVNLMIFADHGMTASSSNRVIDITEVIDQSEYVTIMAAGAYVSIYTVPGKELQVYTKLATLHPNMTVYRKSDLPDRWHYKHGPYVAPLTAVADLGYFIFTPHMKEANRTVNKGSHGYDIDYIDMQGIFLAMGPAFKKGQRVERLRAVDLYQVMCRILNIRPSPHNGTLSYVTPLLNDVSGASTVTSTSWVTVLTVWLVFLSSCCQG